MKFHNVEQGSKEWHELRKGVATASEFKRIMMPVKMQLSTGADKYIAELIGESFSPYLPERAESYTSKSMEWGKLNEEEARKFYAFHTGLEVTNGGFCLTDDGKLGCSTDGMVGDEGCVEIKCPEAGQHVQYLLADEVPADYKPQVHGQLIVTGRLWCDFVSYSQGLPPFIKRVTPDLYTIQLAKMIKDEFLPKLAATLARVQAKAAD